MHIKTKNNQTTTIQYLTSIEILLDKLIMKNEYYKIFNTEAYSKEKSIIDHQNRMNQIDNQKEKQREVIMNRIGKVLDNAKKIIIRPQRPFELKLKLKTVNRKDINLKEETISDYDI